MSIRMTSTHMYWFMCISTTPWLSLPSGWSSLKIQRGWRMMTDGPWMIWWYIDIHYDSWWLDQDPFGSHGLSPLRPSILAANPQELPLWVSALARCHGWMSLVRYIIHTYQLDHYWVRSRWEDDVMREISIDCLTMGWTSSRFSMKPRDFQIDRYPIQGSIPAVKTSD